MNDNSLKFAEKMYLVSGKDLKKYGITKRTNVGLSTNNNQMNIADQEMKNYADTFYRKNSEKNFEESREWENFGNKIKPLMGSLNNEQQQGFMTPRLDFDKIETMLRLVPEVEIRNNEVYLQRVKIGSLPSIIAEVRKLHLKSPFEIHSFLYSAKNTFSHSPPNPLSFTGAIPKKTVKSDSPLTSNDRLAAAAPRSIVSFAEPDAATLLEAAASLEKKPDGATPIEDDEDERVNISPTKRKKKIEKNDELIKPLVDDALPINLFSTNNLNAAYQALQEPSLKPQPVAAAPSPMTSRDFKVSNSSNEENQPKSILKQPTSPLKINNPFSATNAIEAYQGLDGVSTRERVRTATGDVLHPSVLAAALRQSPKRKKEKDKEKDKKKGEAWVVQ